MTWDIGSAKTDELRTGYDRANRACKAAVAMALAVLCTYLFMATRSTLWDRDEPRFARATVEMVESGNYLVPSFNGEMWLDKPVFTYWAMSLAVRLLGPTELAFRFFGGVGTAATCLLTFFIGKRLLNPSAGLWAMVILASTLLMLCIGTAATADAILLPFIVAVPAVFVQTTTCKATWLHIVVIGCALGIGMLIKGPIGLMPVPVVLAALWFGRKLTPEFGFRLWQLGAALFLAFLILGAWVIPANNATDGGFLRVFVGRHVITRALRPMEHHGGNLLLYLPYYIPVVIVGLFPWTLYLPGALSASIGGRIGGRHGKVLLLGWIVPVVVLMSLAATKLPNYILFVWPALSLLVAGVIGLIQRGDLTERDRVWLRRGVWFFVPLPALSGLLLMIGPWFLRVPGLGWPATACGIVLLAMAATAIGYRQVDRSTVLPRVLVVEMIIFHIPYLFGALPTVESVKISPYIAEVIKNSTSEDTPVATYKFGEPTLNFYVGRTIETLRSEEDVVDWTERPMKGILVAPKKEVIRLKEHHGVLPLDEIASKEGFNYSKGKRLEVVALMRRRKSVDL